MILSFCRWLTNDFNRQNIKYNRIFFTTVRPPILSFGPKYNGKRPYLATFSWNILFCHNFWTNEYFPILLSQVVHIFPVIWIDTNIDHMYGHIMACHSGHYDHFVENGYYGESQYGHQYGLYWCLCQEQERYGYPVKAELKNVRRFKIYG